jgi:hypothetical protein
MSTDAALSIILDASSISPCEGANIFKYDLEQLHSTGRLDRGLLQYRAQLRKTLDINHWLSIWMPPTALNSRGNSFVLREPATTVECFGCALQYAGHSIVYANLVVDSAQLVRGADEQELPTRTEVRLKGFLRLENLPPEGFIIRGDAQEVSVNGSVLPSTRWALLSSDIRAGIIGGILGVTATLLGLVLSRNPERSSKENGRPRRRRTRR